MLKFKNKKFLMLASAAMVALPVAMAGAVSTTINASASFATALTVTPVDDMSFASWYFGHALIAGDHLDLGTDDSVTPTANFQFNSGTKKAGKVTVAGATGTTFPIEVRCSPTAAMYEATATTSRIDVVGIKVTNGAGAAYPAGDTCSTSTPVIYNLVAGAATLKFGGRIDGATAVTFVAGDYSTLNGAGTPITVDVLYQ